MLSRSINKFNYRNLHTLIISEINNNKLNETLLNSYSAAKKIGGKIDILVTSNNNNIIDNIKKLPINKILYSNNNAYQNGLSENISLLINNIINNNKDYTHVISASTSYGKNIIPRAAALSNMAPITDIINIKSENTFIRPIYAGNALSTVESSDKIKFMTIRPTNFEKATYGESKDIPMEDVKLPENPETNHATFIKNEGKVSDKVELTAAVFYFLVILIHFRMLLLLVVEV